LRGPVIFLNRKAFFSLHIWCPIPENLLLLKSELKSNRKYMEKRIVECVPKFSEGRDKNIIRQIPSASEAVEGVKLLDVDPGEATNRTVVTFVGEPEAVVEAAFEGVKKAAELIDMSKHHGAHPRMG